MPYLKINNRTISKPIIDIVKDIKNIIYNGKLKTVRVRGDNIRVTCPFHKNGLEDRASSDIYIGDKNDELEYGWFKCFTCGENAPFYHFVAECLEISDSEAKAWLIRNYADGTLDYEIELPPIILNNNKKEFLDESILDTFENFHPYMAQRKLAKNITELFQVKYDPATKCLVFPVRDEKGRLVMFTRRSVTDKRFIIDKEKEKPLYLLYYMLQNNIQEVMITEAQIDALTACGYGFPCIATMGAISDHQIDLLNKSGIRVLYTMFDNDEAGNRFTNKIINNLNKDILIVNVKILFNDKKDINDLTFDEFYECINSAENKNL